MPAKLDLYNGAYSHYEDDVYRQIRAETYGKDLGQTSWVTTEESDEIPLALELAPGSYVLEIGCGSGRYALQVGATARCRVLGIDISSLGIDTANRLSADAGMSTQVRFENCDAAKKLPFDDATFDAAFSNDVLCHVPGRLAVLQEVFRVLRPGGRFLFSDALVIGGTISHEEIAARSSIGYYSFSPPGVNERMIEQAGFGPLRASDTSQSAALIAERWHAARERKSEVLVTIEGKAGFEGLQRFLSTVHTLTSEGRLLRYVYLAQKPS
jgi:SAM-dependent methyltransferase